jgi:hypothetical protein
VQKLCLFEIIEDSPDSAIRLGMSLNKFATLCNGPKAWTFPWESTFPGSLEYGDLLITLDLDKDVVRIIGMRIRLWETAFPDEGDPYPVPLKIPKFSRDIRLDLQGFFPGQSIPEVQAVLSARNIHHRLFGELRHTEVGNHIVANDNTHFDFCRDEQRPWLMSISIVHELHPFWPISSGLKSA